MCLHRGLGVDVSPHVVLKELSSVVGKGWRLGMGREERAWDLAEEGKGTGAEEGKGKRCRRGKGNMCRRGKGKRCRREGEGEKQKE